ncbi:hypothetical protein SUDANB106_00039 [Streptomyces sp. enrichment culture]|uniref:hypothetical protein n=1 Tax=Streptomyces sp. enrichment culture TaxID=1795815 RepID=UPI003F567151
MGPGTTPRPLQRTWTVTIHPRCGVPTLRCAACGLLPRSSGASPIRRLVLAHLADHASRSPLPPHLRTCQCREDGCRRHSRHRGCDGPLLLLLTRDLRGRTWHLADTCHACATATPHSARVPETPSWETQGAPGGTAPSGAPCAFDESGTPSPKAHTPGPGSVPAYDDGDTAEQGAWWSEDAETYTWPL